MVAGPEVADVRELEVADRATTFLLRETRLGVVVVVLPAVVQAQQQGRRGEDARCYQIGHAWRRAGIYTNVSVSE